MNTKTKRLFQLAVGVLALSALPTLADQVIIYARTNITDPAPGYALNRWPPYIQYSNNCQWYRSSGYSTVQDPPVDQNKGLYFGYQGRPSWAVKPTLSGTGHVYALYATLPTSDYIPTDITIDVVVDPADGTVSTNRTDAFGISQNTWNLIGYLTNAPGVYQPVVTFNYSSNLMDGVTEQTNCTTMDVRRVYSTPVLFDDITDQCWKTPKPTVYAPLVAGQTNVTVAGVTNAATNVTVYANGTPIGQLTTGIVDGTNTVPVTALVAGAEIKATQKMNDLESCLPPTGPLVSAGPNPSIRVGLVLAQSAAYAGPIGAQGTILNVLYHIPATSTLNGMFAYPPQGNVVLNPDTCWKNISAQKGVDPAYGYLLGTPTWDPNLPISADPNPYAALSSIAFCARDLTNLGPFDIYIDNIMNGTNMIQDFESATNGQPEVLLRKPSTATLPAPSLVAGMNIAEVSTNQAAKGSKSLRLSWEFASAANNTWMRILLNGTNGSTPNPQVNLSLPISFDILLLPSGQTNGHYLGTVSSLENQDKCPDESATFSVTASDGGPFTYQWKRNNSNIGGATNSSFTTNNVRTASSGTYSVVVSDGTCSATRSALLTVLPLAEITGQPTDLTVNVGEQAQFYCYAQTVAPCIDPFYYQWQHNGTNLPGKTDYVLTINNAQVPDAGTYRVRLTNSYGTVTSSNAILHVIAPGEIIGTGTGLLGNYYSNHFSSNAFFGSPSLTRVDPNLEFDWITDSPDISLINTDYFTVRWSGWLQPKWPQTYTFLASTDDGVRLWVNRQQVINTWINKGSNEVRSTAIPLTTNLQPIVMEYFENAGNAVAKLAWESASQLPEMIPQSQLYPSPVLGAQASGGNVTFDWPGGGVLQSSLNVTGVYADISGATSPYTTNFSSPVRQFFRVRSP